MSMAENRVSDRSSRSRCHLQAQKPESCYVISGLDQPSKALPEQTAHAVPTGHGKMLVASLAARNDARRADFGEVGCNCFADHLQARCSGATTRRES
jgi:hypothetical protein